MSMRFRRVAIGTGDLYMDAYIYIFAILLDGNLRQRFIIKHQIKESNKFARLDLTYSY